MSRRQPAACVGGTLTQASLGALGRRSALTACLSPLLLCCSGLGYVLGSAVKALTGSWHWALRVSPASFSSFCFALGRQGLSSLQWP